MFGGREGRGTIFVIGVHIHVCRIEGMIATATVIVIAIVMAIGTIGGQGAAI